MHLYFQGERDTNRERARQRKKKSKTDRESERVCERKSKMENERDSVDGLRDKPSAFSSSQPSYTCDCKLLKWL